MDSDTKDVVVTTGEVKRGRGRPPKSQVVSENEGSNTDAQIAELQAQIKLLTSALTQSRQSPAEDEETIGIMKVGGGNLSVFLTDAYGREKHFYWETDGEILYMTPAQYDELLDLPGGKKFLEKKWLQLASDPVSPFLKIDNYVNNLSIDKIYDEIEAIEEVTVLQRMLAHLESKRVITEDGEGQPLVTPEGAPRADVIDWTSKERMVAQACVDRLFELTGVRYSLTDG